jgi:hypothetical protein
MRIEVQSFLGILTNVDDSICLVDFGRGFKAKKRPMRRIMRLVAELNDLPEHEVQFLFEEQYNCVTPDGKSIYVIKGKAKIPTITGTNAQNATDEEWYHTWRLSKLFISESPSA